MSVQDRPEYAGFVADLVVVDEINDIPAVSEEESTEFDCS